MSRDELELCYEWFDENRFTSILLLVNRKQDFHFAAVIFSGNEHTTACGDPLNVVRTRTPLTTN